MKYIIYNGAFAHYLITGDMEVNAFNNIVVKTGFVVSKWECINDKYSFYVGQKLDNILLEKAGVEIIPSFNIEDFIKEKLIDII